MKFEIKIERYQHNIIWKLLVHFFQKVDVAEKNYGGIRALGLTGNPFFDLAAGYGFILILYFYSFTLKNSNIFRITIKR